MFKNRRNLILIVFFLLVLTGLSLLFLIFRYYTFSPIKFVKENFFMPKGLDPLTFIFVYIISIIIFIPLYYLTFNAIFLYGTVNGTIYSIIGMTISSILSFYIARFLAKPFFESFLIKRFTNLGKLKSNNRNDFLNVLILRISPIPFNIVNVFSGVSKTKTSSYIIATLLWMIPEIILLGLIGELILLHFNLFKLFLVLFILIFIYLFKNNLKKYNN